MELDAYIEQINELRHAVRKLEHELVSTRAATNNAVKKNEVTVRGYSLNPDTARNAVVMSEIIGSALSKRRRIR